MSALDRYVFRQMTGPFLFFVLVFTGVIWLSQSLRIIDTVVNNGQTAMVFVEFTVLLLPMVMSVVLPVAALSATLYVINRLAGDSEIVAMFAAGVSPTALLRPVALFSSAVMLFLFVDTLYLLPTSKRVMQERVSEVRGDIAAAFLREGAFVSPIRDVTVYLREMGRPGEMLGLFVHDARDPDAVMTYTAERAVLVSGTGEPRIVMYDGVAQTLSAAGGPQTAELSILGFERLTYDLSLVAEREGPRLRKPSEFYLPHLLTVEEGETGLHTLGDYRAEAHEALSAPLYVVALPLLATALLLQAGFRREGLTERLVIAVVAALGLRLAGLAAKSATAAAAGLWPLLYAPPAIALGFAVWLLAGGRIRAGLLALKVARTGRAPAHGNRGWR
ncbi:MAG: LPS export ABC transporter permease LptF [Paracoccaceae bacterium]